MSGSSQILTRFFGPSVTSTYPPFNGLAAGPSNIVMVEGSRIEWTNLTGGSPVVQRAHCRARPDRADLENSRA
jgi:hypothetical protein